MNHIATLAHIRRRELALGPRFGLVVIVQRQGFGSRGSRSGQIFDIFEILGGAGDIDNSISMPNYCDGSHIHVGVYTIKDTSALTDVLVSPWPSRASIMPPGGRCLGDF